LFWFDGEFPHWWTRADGDEIYKFVRTLKPSLIVNDRVGKNYRGDGDYHIIEAELPEIPPDYDWELCITPNDSWGYNSFKEYWKKPKTLVEELVSITAAGGVMLLNVGPDGQGRIPDKTKELFGEIGSWMRQNSESIYGTRGTYYPYLPNYIKTTTKDGVLYLHLFTIPVNGLVSIPALQNSIISMKTLAGGTTVPYEQAGNMLHIDVSGITPDRYVTVIEISVNDGVPRVIAGMPDSAPRSDDFALQAVITASENSDGSEFVTDRNNRTRWVADGRMDGENTAWLEFAFAAPVTVNSVYLRQNEGHNGRSYRNWTETFEIETWDGSQWVGAHTGHDIEIAKRYDFTAPVTAGRIRLKITEGVSPQLIRVELYYITWRF
jgi:alpha-L-fucosidase